MIVCQAQWNWKSSVYHRFGQCCGILLRFNFKPNLAPFSKSLFFILWARQMNQVQEKVHTHIFGICLKAPFTNAYVVWGGYNLFSKHCLLQCLFMNVFPYTDIGHTQKTAHISKRQTMKYSNLSANVEKMWIDLQMMRKVRRKKLNSIDLSTPSQYFNANACLEYSITIPHFFLP